MLPAWTDQFLEDRSPINPALIRDEAVISLLSKRSRLLGLFRNIVPTNVALCKQRDVLLQRIDISRQLGRSGWIQE